jgi:hypothetical protein
MGSLFYLGDCVKEWDLVSPYKAVPLPNLGVGQAQVIPLVVGSLSSVRIGMGLCADR